MTRNILIKILQFSRNILSPISISNMRARVSIIKFFFPIKLIFVFNFVQPSFFLFSSN